MFEFSNVCKGVWTVWLLLGSGSAVRPVMDDWRVGLPIARMRFAISGQRQYNSE